MDEAVDEDSKEKNSDETDQQPNTIADRRKLYENRSLSLVEEKRKSPTIVGRQESFKEPEHPKKNENKTNGSVSKRTSTVFGKVSKFRHLKGTTGHKSTHIENIKNISRQISGECDGFHGEHYYAIFKC